MCWAIWKIQNKACFEGKIISNPNELICSTCVFIKYWAGLHDGADRANLKEGAALLLDLATSSSTGGGLRRIGGIELALHLLKTVQVFCLALLPSLLL